jgi:hypothetical protein
MSRLNQERQAELEPKRMQTCKEKLEDMGFVVESVGGDRLEFEFKGKKVVFWPYSGWHSGKTISDGRGFRHLLNQLGYVK